MVKDFIWPTEFVSEILTLLDRVEIKEDSSLAAQRFDIARKYGMTVEFGEQISSELH